MRSKIRRNSGRACPSPALPLLILPRSPSNRGRPLPRNGGDVPSAVPRRLGTEWGWRGSHGCPLPRSKAEAEAIEKELLEDYRFGRQQLIEMWGHACAVAVTKVRRPAGLRTPFVGGGFTAGCSATPIPSHPIPSHPIPWFPSLGFAPGPGRGLSPAGSAALPIPTVPRAAASLLLFATAFCHPVHAFPRGELGSPEPLCAPQGKLSPSPGA